MRFAELQLKDGTPIWVNADQVKVLRPVGAEGTNVELSQNYGVEVKGKPADVARLLER